MSAQPEVRARHMHTFLKQVDRLPSADAAAIRQAVPADVLSRIEQASGVAWLPLGDDVALTHAVWRRLPKGRREAFFRDLLLAGFETPLLGGFVQGALRLASRSPLFVLKRIPSGFGLVYRNCGRWEIEEQPGAKAARLELHEAPEPVAGDDVLLMSIAASFEATFTLVQAEGRIDLETSDAAAGRATLGASWD